MSGQDLSSTPSPLKESKAILVYYNPKPTIRVCIRFTHAEVATMSIAEIISASITKLSNDYLLTIKESDSNYTVFPASKTGSKRNGYPEIDRKLKMSQVGCRRLYLQEIMKSNSLISTQYNLERKYGIEKKGKRENLCCGLLKFFTP